MLHLSGTKILQPGLLVRANRRIACTSRRDNLQKSSAMTKELWALDFDGVVCDSCGESSVTAWKV